MRDTLAVSDLLLVDSPDPYPLDLAAMAALLDRVQRAVRRLGSKTSAEWHVSDPSLFQDGALFTTATSGAPSSPTVILLSKFGGLITTARFGNPPYTYSPEQIASFIQLLEADYQFRFAPPAILNHDYSGPFSRYKVGTWFQRFFCDVYWTAGKPHEGQLRWP